MKIETKYKIGQEIFNVSKNGLNKFIIESIEIISDSHFEIGFKIGYRLNNDEYISEYWLNEMNDRDSIFTDKDKAIKHLESIL